MANALKIIVLGPQKSGKTTLSNCLAELTEPATYQETAGLRIVEFELGNVQLEVKAQNFDIELWDCSGSLSYSNGWPTMVENLNGIVFVLPPTISKNDVFTKSIHKYLQENSYINIENSCIMINHTDGDSTNVRVDMPKGFEEIPMSHVNISQEPNEVRKIFSQFIGSIYGNYIKRSQTEELEMITN